MDVSLFHVADIDYVPVNRTLLFGPGVVKQCTKVFIEEDGVTEISEVFTVELSTSDPDVILDPGSANVTILGNDSKFVWHQQVYMILTTITINGCNAGVAVRLQQLAYEVSEGDLSVMICAELIGETEREVVISLTTSNDPG